jgi:hypothetical protein
MPDFTLGRGGPRGRPGIAAAPGPVAADAIIAVVTGTVRTGVALAAPVLGPLLRPERWSRRLRALAETGFAQRQKATEDAVRLFRKVAPDVVMTVVDELDLVGIVRGVVDEIDLPEIIRVSTGSVAGETVRDARIQLIAADDVVARWAGRVFPARKAGDAARHDG